MQRNFSDVIHKESMMKSFPCLFYIELILFSKSVREKRMKWKYVDILEEQINDKEQYFDLIMDKITLSVDAYIQRML